jgi:molybdopterin converting factor small subunit
MILRRKDGALTDAEKPIVKALLAKGWRGQDIQALVNIGRNATINSGRITETKKDDSIVIADDDVVEFYKIRKRSYDHKTGLNLFDHERIIRAREATILAVQVFNSPAMCFKTEVFTMLANVAWTYLLHEFYERKGVRIIGNDGRSLLLSQMLSRQDCPLNKGVKDNLRAVSILRNDVEHKLLGRADYKWLGLFQACCLNFDKVMCDLFGSRLSLTHELSFMLQFTKMNLEQLTTLNKYEVPAYIDAVDARLAEGMSDAQIADLEYQFRVIYTVDAVSKTRAHFQFVQPESSEGKDIRNVLVKHKLADEDYPHKPGDVVKMVEASTGEKFTQYNHTQAWRKYQVRPRKGVAQPENTNKDYCIYHGAHNDYTFSNQWVQFLESLVSDTNDFTTLKAFRI